MNKEGLIRFMCAACGKRTLDFPMYKNEVSDPNRGGKYQEWCDYCGRRCKHCGHMTGRGDVCAACENKASAQAGS